MRWAPSNIDVVLFDFDGTLVDSAPDMADAANEMRAARGLPPMSFDALRRMVGSGARGMLGVAMDVQPGHSNFDELRAEFLARYEVRMCQRTQVFAGMHEVLAALQSKGLRWGVVTNKALRLAEPILNSVGLAPNCATLVAGDSTPFTKPHPQPLLEAARRLLVNPDRCLYVGDDVRDVRAGRAAGMATGAAAWGYLGDAGPIGEWGADGVLPAPSALLNWMELA
jgi:N-acetyl-D-muramate 6-phosphate phosphatase